ncbi:MAG: hypothetical protein IPK99_13795 [Flavobacteriales bacterium]|nr:hypothetical protein [Flavobacteriales bacterium]
MPIPVMTGIGHDVDVSVVDMLARSHHKTPTAIADFLVDRSLFFETSLSGYWSTSTTPFWKPSPSIMKR